MAVEAYREPPRQKGCKPYEDLSGVEKLEVRVFHFTVSCFFFVNRMLQHFQYCSNVLLPEAIMQLLLWRSGERKSLDLLSPEEEHRMHEIAAVKAQETDWVHDVMRLRDATLRSQKRAAPATAKDAPTGTRSRPGRKSMGRS
jgi:hypothetical protein